MVEVGHSDNMLTFILYAFLVERYVISVETPANGVQTRSIGFRVEPRIRALYPDKNDPELLRIGGLEDWQIQRFGLPAPFSFFDSVCLHPSHSLLASQTWRLARRHG